MLLGRDGIALTSEIKLEPGVYIFSSKSSWSGIAISESAAQRLLCSATINAYSDKIESRSDEFYYVWFAPQIIDAVFYDCPRLFIRFINTCTSYRYLGSGQKVRQLLRGLYEHFRSNSDAINMIPVFERIDSEYKPAEE